ncbi:MAG: hypothetical protein ACR2I1_06220 [Propionibacteriaceae bacterium]
MKALEIFAGPILRLVRQDLVTIWFATTRPMKFEAAVRSVGAKAWLATVCSRDSIEVFGKLHVHLARVSFGDKTLLPADTLLEYAIGEIGPSGDPDYEEFKGLVAADKLAYEGFDFPSFYIQKKSRPLVALYGSCRKPHDLKGGDDDALGYGDDVIATAPRALDQRPTVLCLGGDQIYADDVHDLVFDQLAAVASAVGAPAEILPAGLSLPGKGNRQAFVQTHAAFTSGEAKNHLVTFAEYVAMYGLSLNRSNWPATVTGKEVVSYVGALAKVRRLMANTPTYMIFDDHDVTDDWNLSVQWEADVYAHKLGKRIVANALCAFWLFQGWGNQPERYDRDLVDVLNVVAGRTETPAVYEEYFWALPDWEFATPTYPFVYFLDTRTRRGSTTGRGTGSRGAPAYLKDVGAWKVTVERINKLTARQGGGYPLVLVAPAPVYGFERVDKAQAAISNVAGPYFLDFEGWAANTRHLLTFARLCGANDVVLLSGDVHYGFTATVRFDTFDDEWMREVRRAFPAMTLPATAGGASASYDFLWSARFLQLTSSALRNFADSMVQTLAGIGHLTGWYVNQAGTIAKGWYAAPSFHVAQWQLGALGLREVDVVKSLAEVKPRSSFVIRYNDTYNANYLPSHNLGLATFRGRTLSNVFLTAKGQVGGKAWDFNNAKPWDTP